MCMYVSVSAREHISGTAGHIGTKFCVQIPCGRGSVLLRRRCATLCTSGFMDDVTFGRSGAYARARTEAGEVWRIARPGRSLMSVNEMSLGLTPAVNDTGQESGDELYKISKFLIVSACSQTCKQCLQTASASSHRPPTGAKPCTPLRYPVGYSPLPASENCWHWHWLNTVM